MPHLRRRGTNRGASNETEKAQKEMTPDGRRDRMGGGRHTPYRDVYNNRYTTPYLQTHYFDKKKEVKIVSTSIWCDIDDPKMNAANQVGHPFSSKDTGKQNYVKRNETRNRYGEVVIESEEIDICGYHANGLFQSHKDSPAIQTETRED